MSGANEYMQNDELLRRFLMKHHYSVIKSVGDINRSTFTYHCENEEIPFWAKLTIVDEESKKRVADLRNEIAAIMRLWELFPDGETDSFMLPPGPEVEFRETFEGKEIFGYVRFIVEGKLLGTELRSKNQTFSQWIPSYVAMIKTIDTLPELHLPRTTEKKKDVFEEIILKNAQFWKKELVARVPEEVGKCIDAFVDSLELYLKKNKVVTGTVHGDITPDHIVFLPGMGKPTIVQFTKLCQWYPRFWDSATLYAWARVVLDDREGARQFWDITSKSMTKAQVDHFMMITGVNMMGVLSDYTNPKGEHGPVNLSCEDLEMFMPS